jgi:hypothetical protein
MTRADTLLEYHATPVSPRLSPVDGGTVALSALIAVIVTVGVFVLIPRLQPVFYDFGTKFPVTTAVALRFGERWGWRGVAVVWLLAAVPPAASIPSGRVGRRILRTVLMLVLGLTLAWAIEGIFAPYVRLMLTVERGASYPL